MNKTLHFQQRQSQRGIKDEHICLAFLFGKKSGDKIVLDRRGCQKAMELINEMKKNLAHLLENGGTTVVAANDQLITTYRYDSYSRVASRLH